MLTDILSGLSFFTPQNDDDSLDKMHYYYTSSLQLAFAILFSFKLLAGKPMECWVPAEYAGGWENYAAFRDYDAESSSLLIVMTSSCTVTSLLTFGRGFNFFKPQNEDDSFDLLSYQYTASFLMVMATLVSMKMFTGRPMECWVPAEYKGGWEQYAEMFCWARNTYFVPFEESIPGEIAERDRNQISYYQWTPFFLLVCAFAFYAPCIAWRILNDKSGIRLREIIEQAQDPSNIVPEDRAKNVTGLARHLASIFKHQYHFGIGKGRNRATHKFLRCFNLRYYEAYMTLLYLGIKLLYLGNVTFQLFLMNWFLQADQYSVYGIGVLWDLLNGREWHDSGNFPRVTMCDMQIRVLGNVQRHTVQCVLVINIFTEKLFILLWLWYTILSVLTAMSFLYWSFVSLMPGQRKKFIVRRLELADLDFCAAECEVDLNDFVHNWVKLDGVFVLRMITLHTGRFFVMEIVDAMWDMYREEKEAENEENMKRLVSNDPYDKLHDHRHAPGSPTSDSISLPPGLRPQLKRKNSVLVPLLRGDRVVSDGSDPDLQRIQFLPNSRKRSQGDRHHSGPTRGPPSAAASLGGERRNVFFRNAGITPFREESSTQADDDE